MTKHEYSQLLMQLLTPTLPFYSPQKARLCPGSSAAVYDMAAAGAEGFARPLWGLVPFWAGGGSCPEFEQLYLSGLAAGTDPENPEYWGGFQDIRPALCGNGCHRLRHTDDTSKTVGPSL